MIHQTVIIVIHRNREHTETVSNDTRDQKDTREQGYT